MIIYSGVQYRSFASQNNFSFYFDFSNSISSGQGEIGFSGDNNVYPLFYLNSGNIFDFNQNCVWSYNPRETIRISGNVGDNYINYFINNVPICLYSPKNNFFYDYFYIKTEKSAINYNFFIKGEVPRYSFIFPESAIFGQKFTGVIKNNETNNLNKSFKIFSGTVFDGNVDYDIENIPLFTISGNQSGNIVLKQNFTTGDSIFNPVDSRFTLVLNTNFGNILHDVSFNLIPAPIYFIDFRTGFTGVIGFLEDSTYSKYYNYELRTIFPENEKVTLFLENISGHTGNIFYKNFLASGNILGQAISYIHGFDFITGIGYGIGTTIEKDYFGNTITATISGGIQELQYATGIIRYNYNLPLLGGSGVTSSPPGTTIPASGFLRDPISGFIFGYGIATNNKNIDLTGYYLNTANITTVNRNLSNTGFFTGRYNLNYKNLFWKSNNITGLNYSGFSDRIYGITGNLSGIITSLGVADINRFINVDQLTGSLLIPTINKNLGLFVNSGSGFSSQNNLLANRAFTGVNYFYLTGNNSDIGFYFNNYAVNDKQKITHYSFQLDFNSLQYPFEFDLQLSTNGITWTTIDSKTGENFYQYPGQIIFECNHPHQLINELFLYEYARIFIKSGLNWPHIFTGNRSNSGIGIRNIELYSSLPISVNTSEALFAKYSVIPNLNGYNTTLDNILVSKSFSGEAIYSDDSPSFPAWYCFNSNKTLYPYSEIEKNNINQSFVGYKISGDSFRITDFYIEFESDFKPAGFKIEVSDNNQNYTTIYEKTSNIQNIETGILNLIREYPYIRFNFNERACITPPPSVNINNPCYERVIDLDNYCCEVGWDNICQALYDFCNNRCPSFCSGAGGIGSSSSSSIGFSSSSSSSISPALFRTESMWISVDYNSY